MKVILSIKPQYALKIFTGEKKFEFRRAIFKRPVTTVVVYASSPVQKIIGEFKVNAVLSDNPSEIWDATSEFAGITLEFFDLYFNGKNVAHAIEVMEPVLYEKEMSLFETYGIKPPQSFAYIN